MNKKTLQIENLKIGDIVEIDWLDHYAYSGARPNPMVVRTYGKVDEILDEGIALVQSEVQDVDHIDLRIMAGQFILNGTISSIRKLGGD